MGSSLQTHIIREITTRNQTAKPKGFKDKIKPHTSPGLPLCPGTGIGAGGFGMRWHVGLEE